ncbi:MAG: autotransporter-associated beta strand repeat-containing protein [Verrucomicrobiota bacterium]
MKSKRLLFSKCFGMTTRIFVGSLLAQVSQAGDTWTGTTSQDWNAAANWGGAFPTGSATINLATGNFPIIGANPSFTPVDIIVGTGGAGRLDQSAGTAATGAGNWLFVGANGGTGTYNLTGSASLNAGAVNVGAWGSGGATGTMNVNTSGTINATAGNARPFGFGDASVLVGENGSNGTFKLDNGTVNASFGATFGQGASTGTLNVSGGSLNVTGEIHMGRSGTGTATQTGGLVSSTSYFVIAREQGSTSSYTLNGGTVNAATAAGLTVVGSSRGTTGTLSVGGSGGLTSNAGMVLGEGWQQTGTANGTLNLSGGGLVTVGGTGILMGVDSAAAGTINLDGGTLQANRIHKGAGAGTINFNSGILKAGATNTTNFLTGLTAANVEAGGFLVDTNGFNIAIGQPLLDGGGNGGLAKSSTGVLTLSGNSTYTGATHVNAGTLALGGTGDINASSGIVINGSGAKFIQASGLASTPAITLTQGTLDGTGAVGAVTVGAGTGGIVANGNGNSGQLTADSLAFGGGGTMNLGIAGGFITNIPAIHVTNGLTTSGEGSVLVNVTSTSLLEIGSSYELLSYGGTFAGDVQDFVYSGNTARITGTFEDFGGVITLTLNGDTPKWTGLDSGGQWVAGGTGANKNWKLQTALTATDYIDGDLVLFDDTVTTGTTAVDISAANVSPGSITFDNTDKDYTFSSSGGYGIAGTGLIVKNGTGSVTFTTQNTTTGAINISAGTLQLGDGTTDGSFANNISITNDGTLVYNRSTGSTFTDSSLIGGTGSLVKTGDGTQILTAANNYSGGTTIHTGTLRITTTAGAAATGTINLNGGKFQVDLGAAMDFNYAPAINLAASSTIGNAAAGSAANLQGQINYTGTLTGNDHALDVANTGLARLYLNGTLTGVSQINVLSGAMGFDLNSANNRGAAPVTVASGASLYFAGDNANPITNNLTFNGGTGINGSALYYEGGVPAPAALTGTVTLASGTTTVGGAFTADTVVLAGQITGAGALNKVTANKYTLTGTNDYTGATTISAGTLQVGDGTTDGSIASSSGIANNGALLFNLLGNHTYANTVISTGILTKSGVGTLALSSAGNAIGGTLAVNGGTLALSGGGNALTAPLGMNGGTLDLNSDLGLGSGALINGTGGAILATGGGRLLLNLAAGDIGVANGNTLAINSVIANGTANTVDFWNVANGTGVVVLGGMNTYTGATSIQSGVISISNIGNTGNPGNLGTHGTIHFGVTNISTGTLRYTGTGETTDRVINLLGTTTGAAIEQNGTGLLTFSSGVTATGAGDKTLTLTGTGDGGIAGAIINPPTGAVSVTKAGTGTWTLAGTSTYTGTTTVSAGLLGISQAVLADGAQLVIEAAGVLNLTHNTTDQVGSLTINGVVKPHGVYDSANSAPYITGSGKIRVGAAGYSAWATANAGGQTAEKDYDLDGMKNGIEYFMGAIGSSFTANPGIVNDKVVWPKDPAFSGTYMVQTSPDLVDWTDVSSTVVGNTVEYPVPAGQGKLFIRLDVTPN